MRKIVLWLIAAMTLCSPGFAATYHVTKSGSNATSCANSNFTGNDPTKAKLTVAAGVACLAAGDTLLIHAGTYNEAMYDIIPAGTLGSPTIVQAYNSEVVVLRPLTNTLRVIDIEAPKSYITIDGFVIDGINVQYQAIQINTGTTIGGLSTTGITVKNCEVLNSGDIGIYVGPLASACLFKNNNIHHCGRAPADLAPGAHGFYTGGDSITIEDNLIHDNRNIGIQIYSGYAGIVPVGNIIRRNKVYNNSTFSGSDAFGILVGGDSNQVYNNQVWGNAGGIRAFSGSGNLFYSNTIYKNDRWTNVRIGIYITANNTVIKNNILWQNPTAYSLGSGSGTSCSNNLGMPTGTGCANGPAVDPLFVSQAANNFTLTVNSPARNIGADLSATFTTDYAGLTRTLPWDVGAYKYVDATQPVVNITGPASGATVSGTTVAVMANASDDVGVLGVQFKLDGSNLGAEDTVAPYSIVWDSTASSNAVHVLTAVARDAAGNSVTSPSVSVTVANAGAPDASPTVSITSPLNGATVSGTITVSADASDDVSVSGVQFKLDGVNLGSEDISAPYGVSWATTTVSDGMHTLLAVARDGAGHTTTSTAVNVTVSNPPPTISGISAGSITTSAATVSWTTSTASTSQVNYGTTTAYGGQTVLDSTLVTSHSQGLSGLAAFTLYHYRVRSTDILGQETISGDNTFTTAASGATTITVTSPAGGETWLNNSIHAITWTKSADVNGNVRILVSRNGGSTYRTIVNSVPASDLTANWTVKPPTCANCLIRVQSLVAPAVFDNSATFRISNQ